MWFYAVNYQQLGPIPENELRRLYLFRSIPANTLVWKQGMVDWVEITQVPELVHANSTFEESTVPLSELANLPSAERLQTLWKRFIWTLGLTFLALFFWFQYFFSYIDLEQIQLARGTFDFSTLPSNVLLMLSSLTFLSLGMLVICTVFHCMFLYNLWKIIPPSLAPTTPGKAVGFLFIPFFNLYWVFIAYYQLAKKMNMVSGQRGLPPMLSPEFALITCILYIIPQLNSIGAILLVILLYQMKNSAIQIVRSYEEQQTYYR